MTRAEFRRWSEAQPRGRFELVAGEVVAMAPERIGHAQVKAMAWLLLRQAIAAAGAPCQALPDGVTVAVDETTEYEPDALVNCGDAPDPDATTAPHPVIVVEVAPPGTRSVDTGRKLADYFRVPTIRHYLILVTDRRVVIHHRRAAGGGAIETRLIAAGRVEMEPPGIAIAAEALWGT